MRPAIHNFNATITVLHKALEKVYATVSRRMKRAAATVKLPKDIWGQAEDNAFQHVKAALAHAVTLAHQDTGKLSCLFTDASEQHWAGVATQTPHLM